MDWKTIISSVILSSTVIAAFISALVGLFKTYVDNKSKRDDAVALFRYTKLYEISAEWHIKNYNIDSKDSLSIELERNRNLVNCYCLAQPLIYKEYLGDIEKLLDQIKDIKLKMSENIEDQDKVHENLLQLIQTNGSAEKYLELAIYKQMTVLLRTENK